MEYETYFSLPLNGFWDWFMAIPLIMLVFGIPFFYYREHFRKFNQKVFPINFPSYRLLENFVYSKKFAYFWIGGVAVMGIVGFFSVYGEYFSVRKTLLSGTATVVEGTIHNYKAGTNNKGSAYDTFCVKEICFEISDYEVTSGFRQMQVKGSPLKDGLPVRITYVGDIIVRVEIGIATREGCKSTNVEKLNQQNSSEHVLIAEVFWSEKNNNCFVVTRRPFLGTGSDWAIEYFGEPNIKNPNFIEAENFTLNTYLEPATLPYLDETYSYGSLDEYLADHQKYKVWEADFLKKVEQFR